MLSLLFCDGPRSVKKIRHRKSGSAYAGELDAKTGEHLRPADAALPLHTIGDCPVTINSRRTVEIDTMLDPAEIVVDDDQRPAQRRQVAGIPRLDTFKPPALARLAVSFIQQRLCTFVASCRCWVLRVLAPRHRLRHAGLQPGAVP